MRVVATKSGGRRQTDMPSGHPLDIKSAFSIVGCEFGPMRVPRVFRFPKYPSLHDTDRQGKGPAMNMMHRHGIIAAVVAASLGMTLAACSTSGAGTLSSEVTGDVTVSDASATSTTSTISGDGAIDTVEYCFLDGAEGPVIESEVGFEVDGISYKCREDFAAKAIDFRGLYKNVGA